MTTRECRYCGVTFEFNPDDGRSATRLYCSHNCIKRASADRHRAKCVECGALLSPNSGWRKRRWCLDCWRNPEVGPVAERGHEIERLWASGLSRKQIAEQLGLAPGFVSVEFARLREKGFDLPYRNRLTRPKHPELVA